MNATTRPLQPAMRLRLPAPSSAPTTARPVLRVQPHPRGTRDPRTARGRLR